MESRNDRLESRPSFISMRAASAPTRKPAHWAGGRRRRSTGEEVLTLVNDGRSASARAAAIHLTPSQALQNTQPPAASDATRM